MSIEYTLLDDGTMDTVVECHCDECGKTWEERILDTTDESCREIHDLTELLEENDIACECEE